MRLDNDRSKGGSHRELREIVRRFALWSLILAIATWGNAGQRLQESTDA